jgi:glycosyltransferase involved in cell wall biosynthesis
VRILEVIHQFPPFSSQGSEVYCFNLSKELSTTDEVRVFHVSNTRPRYPRRLERSSHDGVPTYHCVDGGEYSRVADWPNTFLRQQFQAVLVEYAPDVVHFHNFISLGDDLVSLARAAGAAVVYTLHDYGLICPNALLLKSDGTLCGKNDGAYFQDCCPVLIRTAGGRSPVIAGTLPSLARWRRFADQQSRPVLRTVLATAVGMAERYLGDPARTDVTRKRDFFLTRTARIVEDTDLFLAPSRFLRDRYIACGVPAAKVEFVRYGMQPIPRLPRQRSAPGVHFGYIGAFHAHKGLELLLEAFRRVGDGAWLHVYGSAFGSPIAESYWQRLREHPIPRVVLHGAYANRDVGRILATLDVVVVPSIWFENSPLTIQEAFMAGVPVITADQGGMAELVRAGVDGLHFRLGDAADLCVQMQRVVDDPAMLETFREHLPQVPAISEQTVQVRRRYQMLVERIRPRPRRSVQDAS